MRRMMRPFSVLFVLLTIQTAPAMAQSWWDAISDGGFELGSPNPYWSEYSEVNTTVIREDLYRDSHTGNWHAHFGSDYYPIADTAHLSQQITLGTGDAFVSFWWKRPQQAENNEDTLELWIDNDLVWRDRPTSGTPPEYSWREEMFDLVYSADGGTHNLHFEMTNTGTSTTGNGTWWLVDDVQVTTRNETLLADFYWEPNDPVAGENVRFWNATTGGGTQWFWDFGDGHTSNEKDPLHAFDTAGSWPVTLTAFGQDAQQSTVTHTVVVTEGPLDPDFTWRPEDPTAGETVVFYPDLTGAPDSLLWAFGDGTTSDEINPQHVFENAGDFTVILDVHRSSDGTSADVEHVVTVRENLVPRFIWSPQVPIVDQDVVFTDLSTGNPTSWLWDFGDDHTSDDQNPTHSWGETGNYPVTLTINRADDISVDITQWVTVSNEDMTAAFTWNPANPEPGQSIDFIDQSTGNPDTWLWDFGDGSDSTGQDPIHTYDEAGDFIVTLTVSRSDNPTYTSTTQHTVTVSAPSLEAWFQWKPLNPTTDDEVVFIDLSKGNPVSWFWDFGDGSSSTEQESSHTFPTAGTYEVILHISNSTDQTAEVTRSLTITQGALPLEADFFWIPRTPDPGETVNFTDASFGGPSTWLWEFGDGATSDTRHPSHAYQEPGQYTITLTITRGKSTASDTKQRTITVPRSIEVDFDWDPVTPRSYEQIAFTEEISEPIEARVWDFGDGETTADENPTHTYLLPGTYRVLLWALNADGTTLGAAEHQITVLPSQLDIAITPSNETPDIGETVTFILTGIGAVDGIDWSFGGLGCDGSDERISCTPTDTNDCLSMEYTYASAGLKPARAWIRFSGNPAVGPFSSSVQVNSEGLCASPPEANFTWWPEEPKVGQPVRCVDLSVGPPDDWKWYFPDGSASNAQHPTHVFNSTGIHEVELTVSNGKGQSSITKTIAIEAVDAVCGNGICEAGETSWSCPQDCLDDSEGTGRIGRKNRNLVIPAAVGGIHGANGTYWVTDGSLVNSGDEDAHVVLEFVEDGKSGGHRVAGPTTIPPHTGIHFDNLVWQLFGTHANGSLWLDADQAVIANTRTFNSSSGATFGQGIGGITTNDVLGEDDGVYYIVGLKQNEFFRTNLLLQETSGKDTVVSIEIHDSTGTLVSSPGIVVGAKSKWQKPITNLGITSLNGGYAVISVKEGGTIAAVGSVIDQKTGDATTLDAVHTFQTGAGRTEKVAGGEQGESHFLVAVVARTPGSNQTVWRSEVSILNPETFDQKLTFRYVPSNGQLMSVRKKLGAGEVFSSEDVIEDLFPSAANGAGSLHILAQKGLVVNSRTYNLLPDDSTVGQAIPGLADGDMARPTEIWMLDSLKQTKDFRCNMGFSEFEGSDATVNVVLFDTDGASLFYLASKQYDVPAFGQFQVNKVFRDMGLTSNFREAISFVSVTSKGGALYVYASIVDNAVGDGTTILAKRR